MLHAGWRGLAGGIVAEGVRAMRELGARRTARVRPSDPAPAVAATRWGRRSTREFADFGDRARRGRNLDLKAIAREQLERAGVEQVHDVGLCTICSDPSLFFSHRRDRGVTGRQAGLAWLS